MTASGRAPTQPGRQLPQRFLPSVSQEQGLDLAVPEVAGPADQPIEVRQAPSGTSDRALVELALALFGLDLARGQKLEGQARPLVDVEVPVEQGVLAEHRRDLGILEHQHLRLGLELPAGLTVEAALDDVVTDDHAPIHAAVGRRIEDQLAGSVLPDAVLRVLLAAFLSLEGHPRLEGPL